MTRRCLGLQPVDVAGWIDYTPCTQPPTATGLCAYHDDENRREQRLLEREIEAKMEEDER